MNSASLPAMCLNGGIGSWAVLGLGQQQVDRWIRAFTLTSAGS